MIPYRNNRVATIAFIAFFALVAGYAFFEARNVLYGPQISIAAPEDALTVTEQFVVIRGAAKNITEIRMNGYPIPVTEAGAFEEPVLLTPGYNAILFTARDKLGRETKEEIRLVYDAPNEPEPQPESETTTAEAEAETEPNTEPEEEQTD